MAGGMGGDGAPQRRQAAHRRILVGAFAQGPGGGVADRRRPVRIGEPLPQIDGAMLRRQERHMGEDGGGTPGEDRIEAARHGGTISGAATGPQFSRVPPGI